MRETGIGEYQQMPDFVIKNGTVIDGTGRKRFRADVAITGDRIEEVSKRIGAGAANGCVEIDATGMIVCPGIVDPHSHADLTIHRENHPELLAPLVRQGITTFVGGNCGMSLAPLTNNHPQCLKMYLEGFTAMELENDLHWKDTAGFINYVEKQGVCMNTALLAPHGLLRIDAMGMENRAARRDEIEVMARRLDDCLDAGCIGMSTGLQYMPGLQSETDELVRLGRVIKKHDGIYASHLRSYMNSLPEAIDELVAIIRKNDIRGQVSHIFWVPDMGPLGPLFREFAKLFINLSKHWTLPAKLDGEIEKQIKKLMRLRRRGVEVGMDVMPTTTTFTHLMAYFPPWAMKGTKEDIGLRLMHAGRRRKMRDDIENGKLVWPHTGTNQWSLNIFKLLGWDCTRIMSVVTEKNKHLEGRKIADVAEERGKHPFDFICDLLIQEEGRVLVFSSVGEPEDSFTEQSLFAPLKHPEVSVSTDTILMGFGRPSYLFYGAYPKFLSRYVREKKMLDLETAVRKITSLPADHFRLEKRGTLKENYFADILVFDPKKIEPRCSFQKPTGNPTGVEHVFINGSHVVDRGDLDLSTMPGRVLKA